jgi:KDO2-lipid IV(A) lauroyltransferase
MIQQGDPGTARAPRDPGPARDSREPGRVDDRGLDPDLAPPLSRRLRGGVVGLALPAFAAVLRPLPWTVVLAAGRAVGDLAFAVQPRRRRRAAEGLARALSRRPDSAEVRAMVRGVFRGLGMNLAEICWVAGDPSRADRLVAFEGLDHLEAARSRGRGVVLITGHLGSWELAAAALVRRGVPLAVIARQAADQQVNEFLVGLRSRFGVRTILRGSAGAARQILRALRDGGALAALIDQDMEAEGIFVDFFGRPAFTPTGPVSLALRAGSPMVFVATWRLPDGTHRLRIDPPIEPDPAGDREAAVRRHTAAFTGWLEGRIREHPEQWVWIHRRWRRRPPAAGGGD